MLLDRLLDLLEEKQLVLPEDRAYTQNLLLDALHLDAPAEGELIGGDIPDCLAELAEWAAQTDVIAVSPGLSLEEAFLSRSTAVV